MTLMITGGNKLPAFFLCYFFHLLCSINVLSRISSLIKPKTTKQKCHSKRKRNIAILSFHSQSKKVIIHYFGKTWLFTWKRLDENIDTSFITISKQLLSTPGTKAPFCTFCPVEVECLPGMTCFLL